MKFIFQLTNTFLEELYISVEVMKLTIYICQAFSPQNSHKYPCNHPVMLMAQTTPTH